MDGRQNRYNQYNNRSYPDYSQNRNTSDRQNGPLSFSDSWKQNVVELAAVGAIVAGAAAMGMNGNALGLANAGKGAIKAVGKGFNRYLDRSLGPAGKLLRQVGVGTFKGLQKMPGDATQKFDRQLLDAQISKAYSTVDKNEVEKIGLERYTQARDKALYDYKKQTGSEEGFHFYGTPAYYEEMARTEMIEKSLHDQKTLGFHEPFDPTKKRTPGQPGQKGDPNAPSTPGESGFLGAAVAGLGFGTGITAFHGIDRALRGWTEDDKQKRERSFSLGGSFLRENGARSMNKTSSVHRHLYETLSHLGAKTPQAVATGLGYTGVSLGTAAALKHHKDLLVDPRHPDALQGSEDHPNGPRVIIELGADPESTPQMGGFTMSPRVAADEELGIAKLGKLSQFLKNVGGRHGEIRHLENRMAGNTVNYKDEAAQVLHGSDLDELAKAKFGTAGTPKDVLESKADELRRKDFAAKDKIEDDVAKDRVTAGAGGLGLLGGGLATAHMLHKSKTKGQKIHES